MRAGWISAAFFTSSTGPGQPRSATFNVVVGTIAEEATVLMFISSCRVAWVLSLGSLKCCPLLWLLLMLWTCSLVAPVWKMLHRSPARVASASVRIIDPCRCRARMWQWERLCHLWSTGSLAYCSRSERLENLRQSSHGGTLLPICRHLQHCWFCYCSSVAGLMATEHPGDRLQQARCPLPLPSFSSSSLCQEPAGAPETEAREGAASAF